MNDLRQKSAKIRLLILDVDGVLTDGKIYLLPDGGEMKVFNTLDGHGIKMLQRNGIQVAIISGRDAPATKYRAEQLGIKHYYGGVSDKISAFNDLLRKTGLSAEVCAYMGDDLPDLPIMRAVGFSACPANAHNLIKQQAHFVSEYQGGNGAVRNLCDIILAAQNIADDDKKAFFA